MFLEKIQIFANLVKSEKNTREWCSAVALDLKNGTLPFLEFTEHLESLLTNTDLVLRRGGIEMLSSVLMELPTNYLKSQEIQFLATFYCDRLLDHHSITPAVLKGFLALLKMENLPPGMVSNIFTVMNLHFVNQSQTQPDRLLCYEIFNIMVLMKPSELQALGPDFVCGYLTAIDSERDPRNLMYLFENIPHFFRTFPPGHLIEDAFETVSCYFPIDFRANPNDPRGISRDDLSRALLPCLTSIPEFIPFVVPLALEKLSSDLQVAKVDSLSLLNECFNSFTNDDILCSHVSEIVSALLEELKMGLIFHDQVVDVLICVINYVAKNGVKERVSEILDKIFAKVYHYLNDIHLSTFPKAVEFLSRISFASHTASRFFAIKVIPKLLAVEISSPQHRISLLHGLKSLLLSCVFHNICCAEIPELQSSWDKIPQLFFNHTDCEHDGVKLAAIDGCSSIVRVLRKEERRFLYDVLCKNILLESDANLSLKYMEYFRGIAEYYPDEIHDAVKIKFETSNVEETNQRIRIVQCYCILATIPHFLIYLDRTIKRYVRADSCEHVGFVIESLKNTIFSEQRNSSFLGALHYEIRLIERLINWWHEGCNAIGDCVFEVYDDEQIAINLRSILSVIIRSLDEKSQQEIADRYFQLTLDYSKRFMNSFAYLNAKNDVDPPNIHCSLSIITFESIINGLRPTVLEESFKTCLTPMIKYLFTLSAYCSRTLCCLIACRSIATIFNKMPTSLNLENEILYVQSGLHSIASAKSTTLKNNCASLHLYVTKSLLLRGYPNLNAWCDQLVGMLEDEDEDVGNRVAIGFRLISSEDEYFLNSSCHCEIKLFYAQRIFSYMVPKLADLYQRCDSIVRKRCAVSALHLLNGVPQIVVKKYFNKVVPLLVELLNTNGDTAFAYQALLKVAEVLDSNASLFENYTETFIPKLLKLSRYANQMSIRIAALECLYGYGKLNLTILLPLKTKILQELAYCLDDKKRLVRRTAVKTRTRWFILGMS